MYNTLASDSLQSLVCDISLVIVKPNGTSSTHPGTQDRALTGPVGLHGSGFGTCRQSASLGQMSCLEV